MANFFGDSIMSEYILIIDQGTTGTTSALIDQNGVWIDSSNCTFTQIFPQPGWVEHNPEEIWQSVKKAIQILFERNKVNSQQIISIGITNQRETIVAWDKKTGKPIHNAIVWQCRRTARDCEKLKEKGIAPLIKKKTGLVLDPYFSATKIAWIIKNIPKAKKLIEQNQLAVGTIDSYLLWRLTDGQSHLTEASNASRTSLMNLKTLEWDKELLKLFKVPQKILPEIKESNFHFGITKNLGFLGDGIPITGILGDQQAALFGQACFERGNVKCTYGTGSFILMNTGNVPIFSKHKMLTTVAWKLNKNATYAIEGGAFICGAAVQWLRDGLGIIKTSEEIETLANMVTSSEGVEFVPALTGLGAPHWDPNARGVICGITRGTTKHHIARATLDAMALQNSDIISAMQGDLKSNINYLNVDGGATKNNLLLQLQADYLGFKVLRPKVIETTAYGAGLMAGIGVGLWKSESELKKLWSKDTEFKPNFSNKKRTLRIKSWKKAIKKTMEE